MANIIKYPLVDSEIIDTFAEALRDTELKYRCNDLYNAGFNSDNDIGDAILKSIQVINQSGLNPRQHFKHIYVTALDTGKTYNDWRLSRMGFMLVLMHANESNPILNKWKIEMVRHMRY